jgi:hypothetical protein
MRLKFTLLISLIIITFPTYAIDGMLIKTLDYSLKDKWYNIKGGSVPIFSVCDSVHKNQNFFLPIVSGDYALDKDRAANAEYSLKITNPNHQPFLSKDGLLLYKSRISNTTAFYMSDAVLGIAFQENDIFGKYDIEVVLTDNNSKKTKILTTSIYLVPLPSYKSFKIKDDDTFSHWMHTYYRSPQPQQAVAHYLYYSQSEMSNNEDGFWAVFSVFLEIAKNNKFLASQFTDCYKEQNFKTKIYFLYLLIYSDIVEQGFFDNLEGDEKAAYQKIKEIPLLDIEGAVTNPRHLDMLWCTFFANGSYKPILKLIQTLDYSKYQGDLDKYKNSKKTEEDREKAINNAIYDALVWSLESNCTQHRLIKDYCDWALANEDLSDVQKKELGKILKKIK